MSFRRNHVSLGLALGFIGGCYDRPGLNGSEGDELSTGTSDESSTGSPSTTLTTTDPDSSSGETPTSDPDSSGANESSTDPGSTGNESSGSSESGPTDSDGDGVLDVDDNCVDVPNDAQGDVDVDGVGDFCDAETIDDGAVLYVPAGTTIDLGQLGCYSTEVRIYGTVHVPGESEGSYGALTLLSPRIVVGEGGVIDASTGGSMGGLPGFDAGGLAGGGIGGACGGGVGAGVGQGGSGAGYGGAGGVPGDDYGMQDCDACGGATVAHCVGLPGGVQGTDTGSDIALGSGGGAAGNSSGCTDSGGRGGNGGGGLALIADERVQIDGQLLVDGEEPPADASACGYRPGGGGGSGGGVMIAAPDIVVGATASLSARGGNGGFALGDVYDGGWGWAGGGGGGGRVKLFGPSISMTGTVTVDGGAGGGTNDAANYGFAGLPGGAGVYSEIAVIPPELVGVQCPV